MERLLAMFNTISKNDNIMQILMLVIREVKALISSSSVAVFVLADEYSKYVQDIQEVSNGSLYYQRFQIPNGQMVDAVSTQPGEILNCFNGPEDVKYGKKDSQFLAYPISDKDDEIQIVIQCESKQNRNKKFAGFQTAEEQILKIICFYLQMRFERRQSLKEVRRREQQVVDTLQLTSEICTQRHHEGLFRKMRETLPSFFGFEAVGVLMYNFEHN